MSISKVVFSCQRPFKNQSPEPKKCDLQVVGMERIFFSFPKALVLSNNTFGKSNTQSLFPIYLVSICLGKGVSIPGSDQCFTPSCALKDPSQQVGEHIGF